jgi:hypothetical protein
VVFSRAGQPQDSGTKCGFHAPRSERIVRLNSDHPNAEQADGDAERIQKLSDRPGADLGKPVELAPAASLPDALSRALDQFGRVFGGRPVVFENRTTEVFDFQGVTLRDGTLMLNAESDALLLAIAAHETLHQMRKDRPDLYRDLADEVRQQGRLPTRPP